MPDFDTPTLPPSGATGNWIDPTYLRQSASIEHPHILWPVPVAPKAKDDAPKNVPAPKYIENTAALLDAYRIHVRWNLMRHTLEVQIPNFSPAGERSENANLSTLIGLATRCGLTQIHVMDHLNTLAREYHPVRDWINSRAWDGTDRIADLMNTLKMPADSDTELAGVLITKWLVSCAAAVMPANLTGRPFTPQGVLTLQGAQGKGKTEWFKSLAPPHSGWIMAGRILDPHDRDSVQQATSHWIVELGEVDATFKRADVAALKAFITQDFDVYRAAYARREERTPRRTVLGATVNRKNFLVDETGNRRWWTVPVQDIVWQHDIDTQQLWAQVAQMVAAGAAWWLTDTEQAQLAGNNKQHEMRDPLVDDLWETWRLPAVASTIAPPRVTLSEIWRALPGRENKTRSRGEAATLLTALREVDAENTTKRDGLPTFRVELIKPANWQPKQGAWNGSD